jgi:hypothetical protein
MKQRLRLVLSACILSCVALPLLHADELQMDNGDRYFGKVLSVSGDTVVFDGEVLGRIRVPRKRVALVTFGTNTVAARMVANAALAPVAAHQSVPAPTSTNADLSAALRSLGANTNFINQVRESMLAGNPAAAGKYDELVGGLLSGKLNMADLRREAQTSANQLRDLKKDLGPDADDSLDGYLEMLNYFLSQTGTAPTNTSPAPLPKPQLQTH